MRCGLGKHEHVVSLLYTGQHVHAEALCKLQQQGARGLHKKRAAEHRLANDQTCHVQPEPVGTGNSQQKTVLLQRVE